MSWCVHGVSMLNHCLDCANIGRRVIDNSGQAGGRVPNERVTVSPPQTPARALDVQIGGGHYKDLKIQPVEFVHANGLGFLEGCVIKRLCRYKQKAGRQDLEKAIHEIQLLIDLEYGTPKVTSSETYHPAAKK